MNENEQDFKHLERVVQGIKMNPDFKVTLETRLRDAHGFYTHKRSIGKRWAYLAAALVCVVIVVLSPLSTLAQQIVETFFARLSTDTSSHTITTTSTIAPVWFDVDSVAEAESALNIDLRELTLPPSYKLQNVSYLDAPLQVTVVYGASGRSLIFTQGQHGWITNSSVGVSATISKVSVNGTEGEYVEGFWIAEGENSRWHNDSPFRRLRWQEDGMQYEIFAIGGSEDTVNINLVVLAENMR